MWLLSNRKILTKQRLVKKDWIGSKFLINVTFVVSGNSGSFVKCAFVRTIWVWMGKFKDVFMTWSKFDDILYFVQTLTF